MDPEGRDRKPPRFSLLRSLLGILLPIAMLVAGIGLTILSSLTVFVPVGTEEFQDAVEPGDTSRPLARMDYSRVAFEAPGLPCPLFVYPLTQLQHEIYLENGNLPQANLNCDRPLLNLTQQVSHFVLRNLDPIEPHNYTVTATYSSGSRPYLVFAIPAIVLIFVGGITLLVRMLVRGVEKAVRDAEQREP
ncbi:MAG: hypothetical protein R3291_04530 [Thermoplasmata archaeon]|nr:hypothetical protein [Thermoplasmata archaeon]